jgi:hypothetical protein
MNTWELASKLSIAGGAVGLCGWMIGATVQEAINRWKERLSRKCARCNHEET